MSTCCIIVMSMALILPSPQLLIGNNNTDIALKNLSIPRDLIPETRVNKYTPGDQYYPCMSALNAATFVVAWSSDGQDGSSTGVYATVFDSTGTNLTNEFRVNTYTNSFQEMPSVCALNPTTFVVAWQSYSQDGGNYGIYAAVFDSTGTNLTNEFRVNTYTPSTQGGPMVCALNATTFVVVWSSYGQEGSNYGVYAAIFNSMGTNLTKEFHVNTNTTGDQFASSVSALNSTSFVVAWTSDGQDGSGNGVYAAVFDSTGINLTNEFRVNTYTADDQESPSISALSPTTFAVAWSSNKIDALAIFVYAAVFDSTGANLTNEFQVNNLISDAQENPSLYALNATTFVVAWEGYGLYGVDQDAYAVVFDSTGTNLTNVFQVNTYATGVQSYPCVCGLNTTAFVVVWMSYEQDGDGYGVFFKGFNRASLLIEGGPGIPGFEFIFVALSLWAIIAVIFAPKTNPILFRERSRHKIS
jgi:hypothetical protein